MQLAAEADRAATSLLRAVDATRNVKAKNDRYCGPCEGLAARRREFRSARRMWLAAASLVPHIAAMHNGVQAQPAHNPDVSRIKLLEAIAKSVLLTARYNGQTLTLAPHALFARHGDLFVSALNLTKNWRSSDEMHLGYFKVAGLASIELTQEPFKALPNSKHSFAHAGDELVLAVV